MGADLYINELFLANRNKYINAFDEACSKRDNFRELRLVQEADKLQNEINELYDKMYSSGYFRDSYNSSSLLWRIDLSWWDNDFINEDGYITPDKAQELLDCVKEKSIKPVAKDEFGTNEYFQQKKEEFIKFLQSAIDGNYNILASV